MDTIQLCFGTATARDDGGVRDHDCEETGLVRPADSLPKPLDELELVFRAHMVHFLIEHAITVEKDRRKGQMLAARTHRVDQRKRLYLKMQTIARKPSFQPIFLPSS